MAYFLGVDTSNYTTSCAIYDSETNTVLQRKKLLPVAEGCLGLRQSDAVFHHTVQLPQLLAELFDEFSGKLEAVGVSDAPLRTEGSYMPCFLAGISVATAISVSSDIPLRRFSHQQGHLMAALYSSGKEELFGKRFLAFHVSGGTTQCLLVDENLDTTLVSSSLDLKAGQAVDRLGVLLGYPFPAGKYVDELACKSERDFKLNIRLKDGNCSLSGLENQYRKMFDNGEKHEDICRFCLQYIMTALRRMAVYAIEKYGEMPVVFSGGVMSSKFIKEKLSAELNAHFAAPEFSSDNAAGIAILTSKG